MICKRRLSDTWRTRDGASGFAAGSRWWSRELRMQEKVAFLTNSVREPESDTPSHTAKGSNYNVQRIFLIYILMANQGKRYLSSQKSEEVCAASHQAQETWFFLLIKVFSICLKSAKVSDGSIRLIQCSIRNDFRESQHIWCKHQRGVRDEPITAQRHWDHSEHVCEWKRGQLGYILYPEVNVQLHCDISMVI